MRIDSYILDLNFDRDLKSYSGKEQIRLSGENEDLILNCSGPHIDEIRVNDQPVKVQKGSREDELILPDRIHGNTTIDITFKAEVSDSLMGLYSASYGDGKRMLTTQFESTGARMAFPCVDHPGFKATFDLTVRIDPGLEVISNMPPLRHETVEGKKVVTFPQTPRMSTYLLYIGIGEFDNQMSPYEGIDVLLTAPRGNLNSTDFPIRVGIQSLEFFNSYFGIKYMLPKMHLIAVPEFGAGAMENWGAITFRETALLVNDSTGGASKKRIAAVIAHEIAHQWFGDLVTMKWWNDLWLNESFATFMMYKVVDHYYPEWKVLSEMVLGRSAGAFTDDSLKQTHPIDVPVKDPEAVSQIFDQISYGKGAMILRMIEAYAGHEEFRNGIHDYLVRFSYENAAGRDLWESVEKSSGKPISRVMEAWIKRGGYPFIRVTHEGDRLLLEQERFLLNGETMGEVWPVPLTIVRNGGVESSLMETSSTELSGAGFVKLNHNETGFYRVLYDDSTYDNMLSSLDSLSYLDKWGIVADMYAFLISGRLSLEKYLARIMKLNQEADFTPVEEISADLWNLHLIAPNNEAVTTGCLAFFRAQLKRIGDLKPGEDMNTSILRGVIYSRLAELDTAFAAELANKFQELEQQVPDIRGAIAIAAAKISGNLDLLVAKFGQLKNDEDRVKVILAMGLIPGVDAVKKVLAMIDDGKIKKQDIQTYFISAGTNPENRSIIIQVLPEFMSRLCKVFRGTGSPSTVLYRITQLAGIGREAEMKELLEQMREPLIEQGIAKGLEMLGINAKFLSGIK